jgi:hypothetical protein
MMPNKTIYVRDSDLPLFEQAQEQLGESISSLFAEFIRDRVAKIKPEGHIIIELMNRIRLKREAVNADSRLPDFLDSEYAEAEAYAGRSLKSLQAGEIKKAKILYFAANTYQEWADRDVKESRELGEKIGRLLEDKATPKKHPRK